MKENKFFKFVWRFNGIALMILIVLAIGLTLYSFFGAFRANTGNSSSRENITIQPDSVQQEHWQLGSIIPVEGSSFVMLPLESGSRHSKSGYEKSTLAAFNFLFINNKNNETHWLFDSNENLILCADLMMENEYRAENSLVRAILYQIVTTDSDGDEELSYLDLQSAGVSLPDGTGYKEILQDINYVIGFHLVDKDNLLLVYRRQGRAYSALVLLKGFTIVSEQELTLAGKGGE